MILEKTVLQVTSNDISFALKRAMIGSRVQMVVAKDFFQEVFDIKVSLCVVSLPLTACGFKTLNYVQQKFLFIHSGARKNLSGGGWVCNSKTRLLKVVLVMGRKIFQTYIPNYSRPIMLFKALCSCMSFFPESIMASVAEGIRALY